VLEAQQICSEVDPEFIEHETSLPRATSRRTGQTPTVQATEEFSQVGAHVPMDFDAEEEAANADTRRLIS